MTRDKQHPSVVVIIPARFASSRFPGKPLAAIAGEPMIAHVVRRALTAASVDGVVVATDDDRIARVAEAAGARVAMTSSEHLSGSDRVAEAVAKMSADIVVNVQGDQPLLEPRHLDRLVSLLAARPEFAVATLVTPLESEVEWRRPDVVKVAVSERDEALYFSRAPIPYTVAVKGALPPGAWKHVGVYGFRRGALLEFAGWAPSPLEQAEGLEQLRILDHGVRIGVVRVAGDTVSVDRPEDIPRVEALLAAHAAAALDAPVPGPPVVRTELRTPPITDDKGSTT